MGIEIIDTAAIHGKEKITNKYFESYLDTSDEWIETRTGIKQRYFSKDENVAELAFKAVQELNLDNINPKILLVATFSSGTVVPAVSATLQKKMNLTDDIFCADVNMGCTGFAGTLMLAERYLKDDEYGIIVASEVISDYMDYNDRKTAVLFGDGAGAVIVKKVKNKLYETNIKTFGNTHDLCLREDKKIFMEGQNVYRFAIDKVPGSIAEVIKKAGLKYEDIDYVICHQANLRIISQISKNTGIPIEKFPVNLERYGNTSAASIPILLNEVAEKINVGDKVLIIAFGAGLTVGSIVMEW